MTKKHINPAFKKAHRTSINSEEDVNRLLVSIQEGNRFALSQGITLVESSNPTDQKLGSILIEKANSLKKSSFRVAITGAPGVGKSTCIEKIGLYAIQQGKRPAVLAIDPSSDISKGSILGDKTRMEELSVHPSAFIRPSSSSGNLGGIGAHTLEAMILCEAAGYDLILVETVGVGQSETMAANITDMFVLLILPGAGDDLQGIKRGIVERADTIVVNKADQGNITAAKIAKKDYSQAIHLFSKKVNGWQTKTHLCSALENSGIKEVYEDIVAFEKFVLENGSLHKQRKIQNLFWFENYLNLHLHQRISQDPQVAEMRDQLQDQVENEKLSVRFATQKLMDALTYNID